MTFEHTGDVGNPPYGDLKNDVVSFRLSRTIPLQSVERYLDIADPFIKTKLRFKILLAHLQSSTLDNIFLISMNFRIPLLKSFIFSHFFSFYSFSSIFKWSLFRSSSCSNVDYWMKININSYYHLITSSGTGGSFGFKPYHWIRRLHKR